MNPATNTSPGVAGYSSNGATNTPANNNTDIGPPTVAGPVADIVTPTGQIAKIGEIGRSGTFIYSGIITNEEYNLELTRFEGIRRYEIMRRSDSTIAAMLDAVKLPVEATNWHMKSPSEKPQHVEATDFVRQELFGRKVNFFKVIQDANLMLDFGYSVMEKVLNYCTFTPKDGEKKLMIGLDGLHFRKHRSIYKWETTEDPAAGVPGKQPGITQYVPGGTYSIPMDKLLVFTFHKEGDNWEGISLLRRVYKDWDIKDKLILINAIRHERQGLGIIQVIAPEDATQDQIDEVIMNARAARASEESVFQNREGYVVEFMDMKSGSSQLTNIIETIEYHDKQIMLAVLAQFVMLGQRSSGSSGSRATSEDQSKLFEMGLESVARNIATTINEQLIKPLCDMNFSDLDGEYPTLEFDKIGDDNITVIGETIARLLSSNGLTMDPDLEQAIRTMLHMPDLPEDIRENYQDRAINLGAGAVPLPQGPAGVNNPADNPKATLKPDGNPQGKTTLTATETPLELLRQTKAAALELLANEHQVD